MYTTGDVIQLFKANGRDTISRQTISNWCKEFAEYLSVTANPPNGSHRRFTQEDLNILALISSMKEMGGTYEDIHASLRIGQRGRLTEPTGTAITPITRQMMILEARITDLEEQLETTAEERERWRVDAAMKDALLKRSDERISEYEREIRRLYEEIGRLKGKSEE